jgi:hypothetical protein
MKKLLIFPTAAATILSCTPPCHNPNLPSESYLIKKGERIEFELSACDGCAMEWEWKNSNNSHIKLISKEKKQCGNFAGTGGGTVISDFVFEAADTGNDSIVMLLRHSFDPDSIPSAEKKIIYLKIN